MINNDEECIEFYNQNLKGKGLKIISLNKKYPDFLTYIRNRFNDTTGNEMVRELIYRIEYEIEEHPKCPVCGKLLEFYKREWKYKSFCSKQCKNSDKGKEIIQQKTVKTNIEKYGCNVGSQSEKVKEKMKQTCLKKYGADCSLKNKKIRNKAIETWLINYGVNNPNKSDNIKEKKKQTCLEKYGVDNPFKSKEIQNKVKQTFLSKYGVEYIMQSNIFREKSKEACLKKYGVEYTFQTNIVKEKSKETCLKKYGVKHITQANIFKQKVKETCLEKYGVEYIMQSDIFKQKSKQTCLEKYGVEYPFQADIFKEKSKQTCLLHYGVQYPAQNKEIMLKTFDSRIKNKTSKFSKKEDEIFNYLITIDNDTMRQYYSELYPFHCDFYLPNFDVYIEYQGMWTHGLHPFDKDNKDDIEILNKWEIKAETSKFYRSAIKNWTITDPLKRKTAKDNKLNYLEIFPNDLYKDKINNYLNKLILKINIKNIY